MKMINSTGNIVADDAVGEHGFNLVQPEGQADKPDLLRTAQPLAGWGQIGGEVCLCYWDALRWALHAATGSKHLATRTIWNVRVSATYITRVLRACFTTLPPITRKLSVGQWLRALRTAYLALPAAERVALEAQPSDLVDCPAPDTIPKTSADGEAVLVAGRPSRSGDPAAMVQDDDATGWFDGPKFVKYVTFADVWARGSQCMGKLGDLYWAAAGEMDGMAQTKLGPLAVLAERAAEVLHIDAALAARRPEDAAFELAKGITTNPIDVAFAVDRPHGVHRRHCMLDELKCCDPTKREAEEHSLVAARLAETVQAWPTLEKTTRGEAENTRVGDYGSIILAAAGLGSTLSYTRLQLLEPIIQKHGPLMSQPDIAALSAADRVSRMTQKLQADLQAGTGQLQTSITTTTNPADNQGNKGTGKQVQRGLALEAAGKEDFLNAEAAAKKLYMAQRYVESIEVLLTGRAEGWTGKPTALARMLLFGRLAPSDLGAQLAWIADLPQFMTEYLSKMVLQPFISDGDIDEELRATLPSRLEPLWECMQKSGHIWKEKLDLEKLLLLPVLGVATNTHFVLSAGTIPYTDAWRNERLARVVGAWAHAIGQAKDGDNSLRWVITSSNQTVGFYGGGDADSSRAILKGQGAYIASSIGEFGAAFELTVSTNPLAEIHPIVLRGESSPAFIAWKNVRKDHADEARKARTKGGSTQQAAPGAHTLSGSPPATQATAQDRRDGLKRDREQYEADARRAAEAAERERLAQQTLLKACKAGATATDEEISFADRDYSLAKIDEKQPGICPFYAIERLRNTPFPLCKKGDQCDKAHELKQQFRLNDCLTDKFADIRDARRSRGTKGGGRGSQKGGGGKGSFGSRGKGGGGKGGRYGKGGK